MRWLLPAVIALSILVGTIVIFYSQETLNIWFPEINLPSEALKFPFWLQLIFNIFGLRQFVITILQLAVLITVTAALIVNYQFWLRAFSLLISLLLAF